MEDPPVERLKSQKNSIILVKIKNPSDAELCIGGENDRKLKSSWMMMNLEKMDDFGRKKKTIL